jgi:hypothetical protein
MAHATFFLTLTVDETSYFRWEEIIDIEKIAKQIHTSLDWKDCPVKCIVVFHFKVDRFMELLLSSHHLLRNIKQHVIWYEIQQHGSLHAHIILGIMENDIERIINEIITFALAIVNNNRNEFIKPIDVI